MTSPASARAFLVPEIEHLERFDFVAIVPSGRPLRVVEVTRREDDELEIRVPGRPKPVPELEMSERSALLDRGFTSEDPSDQLQPWAKQVASAEDAADALLEILTDVFSEKPDAPLDVGHGSHRLEHEATQRLAVARERILGITTDMLGRAPQQDADGDYVLPIEQIHVTVAPRVSPDGQVVVRVFAITNVGVHVTPELGLFLARLNFGLMFGRFALDVEHRSIWFDETLLGEEFREEELRFAIRTVAQIGDGWDDRLKQMFGGSTHQEALAGRVSEGTPPVKPGAGAGLYL